MKLHFVAGVDTDTRYAVAICLERDLVTQCENIDGIRAECDLMVRATLAGDREHGIGTWTRKPPPDHAVAEFRDMPRCIEFEIEVDDAAVLP